ncbi:MAG: GntR family transcriptional regulator [Roseibium sp.]|uniref:GntR family transcriptional regulator n=1 Tax=Roseibium sp. TaxID=1936156 RepID=UPI002609E6CA|nr:GntR family transcriptional regulator [Roseibium sp.]MCV0425645.1 GntR family transcriptional regulator [Roseibium sp.]
MADTSTSNSETPRFRQIVEALREQITNGKLPEHSPLPSERLLAEDHAVSRMTARRALEAVEAEGLVYNIVRQGRFVSPRRLNYNISSMANFVSDARSRGIDLSIELIGSRAIRADRHIAEKLSVPRGTQLQESVRLFKMRDHATFLETELSILERCKGLPGFEELQSRPVCDQRYSPLGESADIVIRLHALNPDEAGKLGMAPHQPAMKQEQLVRDENGVAFCYCLQIWRGELAEFSARSLVIV